MRCLISENLACNAGGDLAVSPSVFRGNHGVASWRAWKIIAISSIAASHLVVVEALREAFSVKCGMKARGNDSAGRCFNAALGVLAARLMAW